MTLRCEEGISRLLRTILARFQKGEDIRESVEFRDVLVLLEAFIPDVLRERHPEWRNESLDGLLPIVARKAEDREVELFGHCILISDQTLTPFHLCLQVSPDKDEVSWLECRLGERGEHGMVRIPYTGTPALKRVYALKDGMDGIDWVYAVTFGSKS